MVSGQFYINVSDVPNKLCLQIMDFQPGEFLNVKVIFCSSAGELVRWICYVGMPYRCVENVGHYSGDVR